MRYAVTLTNGRVRYTDFDRHGIAEDTGLYPWRAMMLPLFHCADSADSDATVAEAFNAQHIVSIQDLEPN